MRIRYFHKHYLIFEQREAEFLVPLDAIIVHNGERFKIISRELNLNSLIIFYKIRLELISQENQ